MPPLRLSDPSRHVEGCEVHVAIGGVRSRAAPRRLPALTTPLVPILTGAALFGASTWAILGPPHWTRHSAHGHQRIPVLEPGSFVLLLSGLAALALVRQICGTPNRRSILSAAWRRYTRTSMICRR
jgi:hypothetical protein